MRRILWILVLLLVLGTAGTLWLTRPTPVAPGTMDGLTGDAVAGRQVFLAAGCADCHADGGAVAQDMPLPAGGRQIATPIGTFTTPNISPDPKAGIGGYSLEDFAGVLLKGVTPDGRHLYPVMPYPSYSLMARQDVADLKAYLDSLPADPTPDAPNALAFPYSLRPGIGVWKALALPDRFVGAAPSAQLERGRYLVEALGHCADCHTPRGRFGIPDRSRWMAGALMPGGLAIAPNLTPAALDWSRDEVVYYLQSGFTPAHDQSTGAMATVIAGLSQLPEEDLQAIAAYLAGLAPIR